MNDREKLIDMLKQMGKKEREQGGVTWYDVADHLIDNGVTFGKDTNVPTKWIPVTERLPEKNTSVITATDNGIVFQCLYAYDGWDLWEGNEVNITHWMPLPELPKEDAE